ncbi:MAG TPA: TRAP transporter fused permease subunit [Vineibacter sp.]|nr:TRAP transporter fused permease subunit [Vineibacter sp.]
MRQLSGWTGFAVGVWAAAATVFHLWSAITGFIEPREMRSVHLGFLVALAFVLWPAHPDRSPKHRPSALDWALAALAVAANVYSYAEASRINLRFENVTPLLPAELVFGTALSLLIIEALRRAVTPVLAGIVAIGIVYLFTAHWLPGILHYQRQIPFAEIVETMFLLNGMGIYGSITGISATMVSIFVIFGAIVEKSRLGTFFHNLGTRVAGRQSGGPAKVEVVASALFGTISGSSTANVYATGSFTIPAMMKLGYRPAFAGGVEAASSVGGQIMPPVMGAGAFVMAEITQIPYSQIVVAALLGAILYFTMILVAVHFEAKRLRLAGVDESEIPSWRTVLADAHLLIPVGVLMVLLFVDYSPHFSAFWAVVATVACCYLRRHSWLSPAELWNMLVGAGRNMVIVALACAGAGMFVASLTVTGLVISISTVVAALAKGSVLIAGGLLMVVTLVLGMGVPTTAAYIIGAAVGAPILQGMGVSVLAAHMFVFYFSILADATPPVSVASYAAASIARTSPMKVGVVAFRLAIAAFVCGFSYLYSEALLMRGPADVIIAEFIVNLLGLAVFAGAMSGYFRADLALWARCLFGGAGLALPLLIAVPTLTRIAIEVAMIAVLWFAPKLFAPALRPGASHATPP